MGKRRVAIEDLYTFQLVADPNISPDGNHVAFVITTLNREANAYRAVIWIVDTETDAEPLQFTGGPGQDFSPRWSPDGSKIAFISDRSGRNQLHVMLADGGEAWQVTTGERPVSEITWLPDGDALLYVAKVEQSNEANAKFDSLLIRDLRHRMDGEGYHDGCWRQIHKQNINGGEAIQLTEGDSDAVQPAISPDGLKLAFVSNRTDERHASTRSDVWTLDLRSGESQQVTDGGGSYGNPSWSPDSERLAYTGNPIVESFGPTTLADLYVWDRDTDEIRGLLGSIEREPNNSAMSDLRYNLPTQRPTWSAAGNAILTLLSDEGNVGILNTTLTGEPVVIAEGPRDIQSFTLASDGSIAFAAASMGQPTEVYVVRNDGRERQLSNLNSDLIAELELGNVEEIRFESDAGVSVHGWLLQPPGLNPEARYPAIIQVHGGPHGMYGSGFFHEMHLLAARGYVVLMTNPRGSTGYGQDWVAGTLADWGGADYRDVMAGVKALEALEYVDSERLGITGGSYGGYMVNWVIGQNNRFKAAVSQRSTANRISLYGTSDINWSYNDWEYDGSPYDNPDFYRERSPLTYVKNVTTPLLLIHSENDLRCPISQSEEFFTALKKLGKEVEFVRFPNESHGLSRLGQPAHRAERLERICGWFDRYL